MSIIRYSFNRQVSLLCEKCCYIAFGHKDYEEKDGKRRGKGFQIDIARQVYDSHRLQGFKYADHGITPKAIAHDIELHLTKKSDLQWEIDEFGHFIFTPTPNYLAKIKQHLLKSQKYNHQFLEQFELSSQQMKQQVHYLDFYVHEQMTLREFVRMVRMEMKARVLQELNNHKVQRTIFRQNNSSDCRAIIQKIGQIVFLGKQLRIQEEQQLYSNDGRIQKETENYQYFSCDGWNTIHFSKKLPNHILLNQFVENNEQRISSLTNGQIIQEIRKINNKKIKNSRKSEKIIEMLENKENLILLYGNLSDQHKFDQIQLLLQFDYRKTEQTNQVSQQLRILRKSYEQLMALGS